MFCADTPVGGIGAGGVGLCGGEGVGVGGLGCSMRLSRVGAERRLRHIAHTFPPCVWCSRCCINALAANTPSGVPSIHPGPLSEGQCSRGTMASVIVNSLLMAYSMALSLIYRSSTPWASTMLFTCGTGSVSWEWAQICRAELLRPTSLAALSNNFCRVSFSCSFVPSSRCCEL